MDVQKIRRLKQDIHFFRGMYAENMELLQSLSETYMGSIKFARVDRLFQMLALDIENASERILLTEESALLEHAANPILKWSDRLQLVKTEEGIDIESLTDRIDELAILIKELDDLHYTQVGSDFIKETMYNYLAILNLLLLLNINFFKLNRNRNKESKAHL